MKITRRSFLKAATFLVAAVILAVFMLHLSPVENAVRRYLVSTLEDRLGGRASIERLDYRLWLGEIRATGVSWSSADDVVVVRVEEVLVVLNRLNGPNWRSLSVRLDAPDIRARRTEGDGDTDADVRIPEWLFDVAATVTNGKLVLGELEVDAIEIGVVPDDGAWEGTLATGQARLVESPWPAEADATSARFRVGSASAEIMESRIDRSSSFATATMKVDSFSPLVAEASITHSIDGSLVRELLPDVDLDGPIMGDATIRHGDDGWTGAGQLETAAVTYAPLLPVRVRAPWRFEGDVLRIVDAELDGYGGEARLSAAADLVANVQELELSFAGIEPHPGLASRVTGAASATFHDWDVSRGRAHADVELRADRAQPGYALSGKVSLDLENGVASMRAPRIVGAGVELDVSGRVGALLALQYTARVADIAALELVPSNVPLAGAAQIEGRVEGTVDEPYATAEIVTSGLSVSGIPLESQASLSWAGSRVELGSASMRHPSGGTMSLRGFFDLDSDTLSLHGDGEDFELHEIPELEASLSSIHVDLGGPLGALRGSAGASMTAVRYRGVSLPSTDFVIDADGTGVRVTGSASGAPWIAGRIDARAPYASELEVALDRVPLGELLRTVPEYADLALELDGRWIGSIELSRPESFRYRVESDQIVGSYHGVGFGVSSPFVAEGDLDALTLTDLTLVGADTAIGVDGTIPLSADGALDVYVRGVARLELLTPWLPESSPSGRVSMELEARGATDAPTLTGDVIISDAALLVGDVRLEDIDGRSRFDGTRVTLEELSGDVLGGRFRVDGDLPLVDTAEARVRFVLDDIDPSGLVDSEEPLGLRLSASGELTGGTVEDLELWHGHGQVESLESRVGALQLKGAEPAPWVLEGGQFSLSELQLTGEDTDFVISGEAKPFAEPIEWSARTSGRIDPSAAAPMLAELGMALAGETELDVRASGGRDPLSVEGAMSIRNGRLSVREPPLAFTNLSGDLVLRNDTLTLTALDANVGGGSVRAEGEIQLVGASVAEVNIRANARSVRLSYPEGLRSEIDGAVRLAGSPDALTLSGDVTLDRAIFSRNINLQSELLESLSRARVLVPVDSLATRTGLDLRVRTQGLRVDNNLANMDASANIVVAGTLAAPELSGTIAAREGGEFRFGRNTYRIDAARIALSSYPTEPPELDITARTTVAGHDIRLVVRGATDDLTTDITGTSQLDGRQVPRADAASLLVTGRTIDKVSTEGRAILGEQMASYLGASLADLAQFGLGGALPFDIVTVEPSLIAAEADPSARFTLGAGLTEELSVVYSIGLDDAEKQIWIVDYRLPRRMRSQLIRQETNEFTFAFGQQLQFDRGGPSDFESGPPVEVSRVGFYFVSAEPEGLESEARDRLAIDRGDRYDYWKAWERAEQLRRWLRDLGFLEATADLAARSCGPACVELDVFVVTGKRVRFAWDGDVLDESFKSALSDAWDGRMTPVFLASDLESLAEGMLFEQRYYLASVQIEVEETPDETVVSVDVARGPQGVRVAVEFMGNDTIPSETLRATLPKRSTSEFHGFITSKRPRLKQILEVRYSALGYLQAEISDPETSFDAASGVLQVTIPVVEGEASVVGRIEIEGVERITESDLRSRLELREGASFGLPQFVQGRSAIAAFYRRQGFPDVEVDAAIVPGDVPGSLVARYRVSEGPEVTIGDIRVVGNDVTRESVIRREVALESGKPLRLSDVSRTQKGLYELGIFRAADVVVSKNVAEPEAAVRDVVIEVAEAPDVTLDYGVRYTTDGLFQVMANVGAPNLFGRAQRVGFRTLLGTDERIFRFTYRAPYMARYKVSTDFFLERTVEEENLDGATDPIMDRTWTFTGQQTRALLEKLGLQWSYSFRRTVTDFEDPEFPDFRPFVKNQSVLTASLIGDHRNSVVSPSRGALWSFTARYAPPIFGASAQFFKVFGQAYTFVPLGNGVVWAAGYRIGAANDFGAPLLEVDRFQAGGPSSVRGFAQGTLGPVDPVAEEPIGGAGVLIVNQEIRFPIVWRISGVGFFDAGNAFDQPSEIRLSDLRHSAGAGLRLELPFGLFRLDWARVLDPQAGDDLSRFVFSLGHAF